jgi:hypothetical protein
MSGLVLSSDAGRNRANSSTTRKETDDPEIRTRNIHNAELAFQAAVKTFRDFGEQTQDWKKAKAELDAVERELHSSR